METQISVKLHCKQMEDLLSKEFKQMLKEMSLDMSIEDVLFGLSMRTPSEDLKLLVNAIRIKKESTIHNLLRGLSNIAQDLSQKKVMDSALMRFI